MPTQLADEVKKKVSQGAAETDKKIEAFLRKSRIQKDAAATAQLSPAGTAALKAIGRILAPYAGEISDAHLTGLMAELGIMPPVTDEQKNKRAEAQDKAVGDGVAAAQAAAEASGAATDQAEDPNLEAAEAEQGAEDQAEEAAEEAEAASDDDGQAEGDEPVSGAEVQDDTAEGSEDLQITQPDAVSDEDHQAAFAQAQDTYRQKLDAGESSEAAFAAAKQTYLLALDAAGYTVQKMAKTREDSMPEHKEGFTPAQRAQIDALLAAKVESLRGENKSLVEKSAKLEADLAVEREDRLAREFAQRAEQYADLAPASEIVPMLKSAHGHPEQMQRLEAVLKSATERLRQSHQEGGLFGELGTRQASERSGPEAELEDLVKSVVSKGADKGSEAQQYVTALKSKEGRALYNKSQKVGR